MPTGSCFCGNVKVEYTGEPAGSALCHCADCRKISGGMFSNNIVVKSQNFKVLEGTPKEISKTADSGKSITSCFCGDCGTTLFRYGDSFGGPEGMRVIKSGILDDSSVLDNIVPKAEYYSGQRIKWIPALDGAKQLPGMP